MSSITPPLIPVLRCRLNQTMPIPLWDEISVFLFHHYSILGIDEKEVPAPQSSDALRNGDEFELAINPGLLEPPLSFDIYFSLKEEVRLARQALSEKLHEFQPYFEISSYEEPDPTLATEEWKKHFQPMHIPPNWFVRASWHAPMEEASGLPLHELIIEPGMAFGTGTHETTQSCLELIAEASFKQPFANKSYLDFGCGSGILAIAFKRLQAAQVYAVDIDSLAVEATQRNAQCNHVDVFASHSVDEAQNTFDGIVANILKNTLLEFAPRFHQWLNPNGFLILSGLLIEQESEILSAYQALGFKEKKRIVKNEWLSLWLSKILC